MTSVNCQACHESVPSDEAVLIRSPEQGYREICSQCFNEHVAAFSELEEGYHDLELEPLDLVDAYGQTHRFYFRFNQLMGQVSLEAFERQGGLPGGYQFQVLGKASGDTFVLLLSLVSRIQRSLAQRHLEDSDQGPQIRDLTVRGRISWDPDGENCPRMVIDGRELRWAEFGRMLMTFEGFQFKLELRDRSEEL